MREFSSVRALGKRDGSETGRASIANTHAIRRSLRHLGAGGQCFAPDARRHFVYAVENDMKSPFLPFLGRRLRTEE